MEQFVMDESNAIRIGDKNSSNKLHGKHSQCEDRGHTWT